LTTRTLGSSRASVDGELQRAVLAAVVDEHHLEGFPSGSTAATMARVHAPDVLFLVVERNDDRQFRHEAYVLIRWVGISSDGERHCIL
jgi:hypothetical protein